MRGAFEGGGGAESGRGSRFFFGGSPPGPAAFFMPPVGFFFGGSPPPGFSFVAMRARIYVPSPGLASGEKESSGKERPDPSSRWGPVA